MIPETQTQTTKADDAGLAWLDGFVLVGGGA